MLSKPCRKRRPSSRDDRGVSWVFSSWGASVGFLTRYDGGENPAATLKNHVVPHSSQYEAFARYRISRPPISRSTLEKNPIPAHLFEGKPVDEGTTRRGTDTRVHRPEKPAGPTNISTSGLSPCKQLERQTIQARTLEWAAISFSNA